MFSIAHACNILHFLAAHCISRIVFFLGRGRGELRAVIKQETFLCLDSLRNASFVETDKFPIKYLTKAYR